MFAFERARATFAQTVALDQVTVQIAGQAMTAVLGPSGSGKSTLLRPRTSGLHPALRLDLAPHVVHDDRHHSDAVGAAAIDRTAAALVPRLIGDGT